MCEKMTNFNRQDIYVGVTADGRRWIGQGSVEIPDDIVDHEVIFNSQIGHRAVRRWKYKQALNTGSVHVEGGYYPCGWHICRPSDKHSERPFTGPGPGGGRSAYI